jgi:uncharacterized protein (TIGR00255 family)
MTGYGRGAAARGDRRVVVELRSVNHRFLDLKLRGVQLPPAIEDQVAARIKARIARGAIAVSVRLEGEAGAGGIRVDLDAARRAYRELERLASELDLDAAIGLSMLSQVPGVLVAADGERADDAAGELILAALDDALAALLAMRATEGATLARDLEGRRAALAAMIERVAGLAAATPAEAERRLRERVGRLLAGGGAGVAIDDVRLAQEVAILADRLDVTEELVRARSHLVQLAAMFTGDGEVGRKLDFLVQELGREYNTIGSKAQSAEIARIVVDAKAELERMREQVQNVE